MSTAPSNSEFYLEIATPSGLSADKAKQLARIQMINALLPVANSAIHMVLNYYVNNEILNTADTPDEQDIIYTESQGQAHLLVNNNTVPLPSNFSGVGTTGTTGAVGAGTRGAKSARVSSIGKRRFRLVKKDPREKKGLFSWFKKKG